MAKKLLVNYKGEEAEFDFKKIDRAKLYGKRKRVYLDASDNECQRAELTSDGSTILRSGMSSQSYFDEKHNWIPNKELVGLDSTGKPLDKKPSTLGVSQTLEGPVDVEELLELSVSSVYQLDVVEVPVGIKKNLDSGGIFKLPFNYREDYHEEAGYLIANKEGIFMIAGNPTESEWLMLDQIPEDTFNEEDFESEDELDFEMF